MLILLELIDVILTVAEVIAPLTIIFPLISNRSRGFVRPMPTLFKPFGLIIRCNP